MNPRRRCRRAGCQGRARAGRPNSHSYVLTERDHHDSHEHSGHSHVDGRAIRRAEEERRQDTDPDERSHDEERNAEADAARAPRQQPEPGERHQRQQESEVEDEVRVHRPSVLLQVSGKLAAGNGCGDLAEPIGREEEGHDDQEPAGHPARKALRDRLGTAIGDGGEPEGERLAREGQRRDVEDGRRVEDDQERIGNIGVDEVAQRADGDQPAADRPTLGSGEAEPQNQHAQQVREVKPVRLRHEDRRVPIDALDEAASEATAAVRPARAASRSESEV